MSNSGSRPGRAGGLPLINYLSHKGRDLVAHQNATLTFYWDALQRQVRRQGVVSKISACESDDYWRARASQLSQWISQQSETVKNRSELEAAYTRAEKDFAGKAVPRPEHWGGYLLTCTSIEFWIGHPHRLHDRFLYTQQKDGHWLPSRLMP